MDITTEKKEYAISGDAGDALVTVYNVFPGVELAYNVVHIDQFNPGTSSKGRFIEIHHCREGRIDLEAASEHLYLTPGDLCVALRNQTISEYRFPMRHYHGIAIAVNLDVVPPCFSQLLEDVYVKPLEVVEKLCRDKKFFVLRNKPYIEHIFSEMYFVPERGRIGYFKVKLLELFLMLDWVDVQDAEAETLLIPGSKAAIAKRVANYLTEHINQHVTIPELARHFNVSESYLKNAFRDVFGVPVYSYVRIQKMQLAAKWLVGSDQPIMQIANECGYGNGSKFTAAFRDVMGETPSEYRRLHTKRSDS